MNAPDLPFQFNATLAKAMSAGEAPAAGWSNSWLKNALDQGRERERDDLLWLADRPAGSAKQHGRSRQAWLFLRLTGDPAADECDRRLRSFLRVCLERRWHTSMAEQLLGRSLHLDGGATPPVFGVLLTGRTFHHLGIEPPVDAVFAGGMAANRAQLGDVAAGALGSATDPWVGFGFEEDFDLVLTVAAETQTEVDSWVRQLANAAGEHGLACVKEERGFQWKPDGIEGGLREPFGFRDDVSNLLFLADDVAKYAARGKYPAASEVGRWDQVYHLPAGKVPTPRSAEGGSFVVFRKLEQKVRDFAAWGSARIPLVGREMSGAPLADPGKGGMNDFDYSADVAVPPRCPFHAHVRKANPRGSSSEPEATERRTLFPRRGMVYAPDHHLPQGPYDASKMPSEGVGLLFVAFMGQIDSQFLRMQTSWLNNPLFPSATPVSGPDGLVGAGSRFVVPRGGAYLYAPPLNWLRSITERPF